ncbi:hypothetical protein AcV7_000871 [Taiwanofungus camphoratus]|nr:hypothetical protein AcV7_000871 [Antrodia cinnamomea]
MVRLLLSIKAELENVTDLVPATDSYEYFFQVKCTSCNEVHPKFVSLNRLEEREVSTGKGNTAHFVWRCGLCKRESSAKFDSGSITQPYSADANGQFAPLLTIDCRGLEFVGFDPRGTWKCVGIGSGTVFDEVDLEEGCPSGWTVEYRKQVDQSLKGFLPWNFQSYMQCCKVYERRNASLVRILDYEPAILCLVVFLQGYTTQEPELAEPVYKLRRTFIGTSTCYLVIAFHPKHIDSMPHGRRFPHPTHDSDIAASRRPPFALQASHIVPRRLLCVLLSFSGLRKTVFWLRASCAGFCLCTT